MRPGTNQTIQSQSPAATAPVDLSAWFIAGITAQGPIAPLPASSLSEWQTIYGGRGTAPIMSDWAETFFNEGGAQLWTSRVVGPSAVYATGILVDTTGSPINVLTVNAIGPGAYANGMKIVVANSTTTYTITVEDANSNVLEVSQTLSSLQDAVNYGATSQYIRISLLSAGLLPKTQTITLASGVDDLADITTGSYTAALALFQGDGNEDIPLTGGVSLPGQTTAALLEALATFVGGTDYYAYGDMPDVTSATTLEGDAAPITALGASARQIGLFTPWLDIPGVAGSTGSRGVPPSAFAAGRTSALVVSTGNPNLPAAGANGLLSTPINAHAAFSPSDRQSLNTAGVNVIRPMAGGFRIYGNVTAVNRQSDPLYFMLSNTRLDGAIAAQANAIQEDFVFTQIDGLGIDVANYGGELVALMTTWWNLGALFGPDGTPATAFSVDTTVNTPTTASEGELIAVISYARAPGAEQVNLNIVRASAATGV